MKTISPYEINRDGIQEEEGEEDFDESWDIGEFGLFVFLGCLPSNRAFALSGNCKIGQSRYMLAQAKFGKNKKSQIMIMKLLYSFDEFEH